MCKPRRHHCFLVLFVAVVVVAAISFPVAMGFAATPRPSSSCRVGKTTRSTTTTVTMFSEPGGSVPQPDGEENLKALFERAVVLQRSGFQEEALENYQRFVKAAKQCSVNPRLFAEVFVNMGAIEMKLKRGGDDNDEAAKQHFETALSKRPIGTAHVNLALIVLRKGKRSSDPRVGLEALEVAKKHCEDAVALNDEKQSVVTATKLLGDIDKMLKQMNHHNNDGVKS